VQGWDCMKHAGKSPTWTVCVPTIFLIMHICPAFFEQLTPFPHILSIHCTFTIHRIICPWIYARWTFLAFKNCIANHTSEVPEFSVLCPTFNDYSNWREKKIWRHTTQKTCSPWWLTFTGRAHHLHDYYSQLVLTFWTYLVYTGMPPSYMRVPLC
jgi:hypothetical protein